MEPIFYILAAGLTWVYIARPYLRYHEAKARRQYDESLRLFKLRQIYRFYPQVLHLECRELEELYDIETSYQNIGRR